MFYVLLVLAIIFITLNPSVPGKQNKSDNFVFFFFSFSVFPGLDEDTGGSGLNIQSVDILEEEKTKNHALNCSFYTFGRYTDGFCTFVGACRVESIDYMYRGVCGQLSLRGEKEIKDLRVRESLDQYNPISLS